MRRRFWKFLPLVLLGIAALFFVLMSLWNWLMPALFGLPAINNWQAIGLFILAKLLFGGFHRGAGGRWRHRMAERWDKMTPEEREKFSQSLAARCGQQTAL